MERVCFCLQVKPALIEEYTKRHAEVWPDMLQALGDSGWRNYSLFLGGDGLLIGYFEAEDPVQARRLMAGTEVNSRWQAEMSRFFEGLDGAPDEGSVQLPEVFNLETQLLRLPPQRATAG